MAMNSEHYTKAQYILHGLWNTVYAFTGEHEHTTHSYLDENVSKARNEWNRKYRCNKIGECWVAIKIENIAHTTCHIVAIICAHMFRAHIWRQSDRSKQQYSKNQAISNHECTVQPAFLLRTSTILSYTRKSEMWCKRALLSTKPMEK